MFSQLGFELVGPTKGDLANDCARFYNLKNAVKGVYPVQQIDYPALRHNPR